METVVTTEAQPVTTRSVLAFPFKVIGKILRVIFWIILIVAIITAGVAGVWLLGKVETGAGEMTRLEAGRVYLKLAWREEPRDCQGLYLTETATTLIVSPLIAIDEAFNISWLEGSGVEPKEIAWWEIPTRTVEIIGIAMHTMLHVGPAGWEHPYRCRLPLPEDWTPELIR